MKYNFDTCNDRRLTTECVKWDVAEGELPLTMADMDFETAPEIKQVFMDRIEHGVFGYADVNAEWYEAYINWWKKRHNFTIEKDWLVFASGVIPTISSGVRKLTTPGEKVLVLTPSYNIFFNSIVNNGRFPQECPLRYQDGKYDLDFDLFEEKISDPQVSLMILCNPHNPIGKIWSKEELSRIADLADKYGVIILSDEIHCDITDPGKSYTPLASVSETAARVSLTAIAASKAFNMAGFQSSAVFSANKVLRHRIWRGLNTDEVGEASIMATISPIACFNMGEEWLDEMREYMYANKQFVRDYVSKNIPQIKIVPSEATYLLWMDCREITPDSTALQEFIRKETGLVLTNGTGYGEGGNGFLRINCAYPRSVIEDGVERLDKAIKAYIK